MKASPEANDAETDSPDRQALLLMLSYVESECRRLGALDAARHAALAADLLPTLQVPAPAVEPAERKPGRLRLH